MKHKNKNQQSLIVFLILLLTFSLTSVGFVQDSTGIRRIGYIPSPEMGGRCAKIRGDYCYAGAEYHNCFKILDISNPADPQLCDEFGEGYFGCDLEIRDNICYMASFLGIKIFDISDPFDIQALWQERNMGDTPYLALDGNYVFLNDFHPPWHNADIWIFDISNPEEAEQVGNYQSYTRDVRDIFARGEYLYVTDMTMGICIVNIEDKANPFNVVSHYVEDPYDVIVRDNYCYVASYGSGFVILDLSDPEWPRDLGNCADPQHARALCIRDSLCYVADWEDGLFIIDISNLEEPRTIASYPTPDSSNACDVDVYGDLCVVAERTGYAFYDISEILNVREDDHTPINFTLSSAYPNPFNSTTTITYTLPTQSPITLGIYNTRGQLVDVLVDGAMAAGRHSVVWDANEIESGVYFVAIGGEGQVKMEANKLVLVK